MVLRHAIRGGNIKSVESFSSLVIPMSQFFKSITSHSFDAKVGQMGGWFASVFVLGMGFYKLSKLPLSETEFIFGVLLVFNVSLLMMLMGMILPLTRR